MKSVIAAALVGCAASTLTMLPGCAPTSRGVELRALLAQTGNSSMLSRERAFFNIDAVYRVACGHVRGGACCPRIALTLS